MLTGLCSLRFFAQHKIIICLFLSLVMPEELSIPYTYPALKSSKQNSTVPAARPHTESLEQLHRPSQWLDMATLWQSHLQTSLLLVFNSSSLVWRPLSKIWLLKCLLFIKQLSPFYVSSDPRLLNGAGALMLLEILCLGYFLTVQKI